MRNVGIGVGVHRIGGALMYLWHRPLLSLTMIGLRINILHLTSNWTSGMKLLSIKLTPRPASFRISRSLPCRRSDHFAYHRTTAPIRIGDLGLGGRDDPEGGRMVFAAEDCASCRAPPGTTGPAETVRRRFLTFPFGPRRPPNNILRSMAPALGAFRISPTPSHDQNELRANILVRLKAARRMGAHFESTGVARQGRYPLRRGPRSQDRASSRRHHQDHRMCNMRLRPAHLSLIHI